MVWLSTHSGSVQSGLYFDIRDVKLACQNGTVEAVVSGLVGDGVQENWGEVFLGTRDRAQILPYWDGHNKVECLTDHVDERLLSIEMIAAAKEYLKTSEVFTVLQNGEQRQQDFTEPACHNAKLAA